MHKHLALHMKNAIIKTVILLCLISLNTACFKDMDDVAQIPEEQEEKEIILTIDGFTTSDTTTVLPETSFGNETTCGIIEDDAFNSEFLELLNAYRISLGLNSLSENTTANFLAFKHTKYMICTLDFNHANFIESSTILTENENSIFASENIIAGANTPQAMLDSWLESPLHKENIENPLVTHTGFSTAINPNGIYYATQLFFQK